MSDTSGIRQRYILGDWGTSRLRLYLMEDGTITDRREGQGIGTLTASPIDTLAGSVAQWMIAGPIDLVLSGMIGSRNGLIELRYAVLPADCAAWSRSSWSTQLRGMNITIATGLCASGEDGVFDVMRGEETQIFGAMRVDPSLRSGAHLFVLPGTHSKWVEVEDGTVVRFRTALTGEVYALLRDHSTLLRAGGAADNSSAEVDTGFIAGARRSAQLPAGLLAAMFEARTAQLLQSRSRAWASGFLSGLLIGYEVAGMSPLYSVDGGVKIIGDKNLASLYQRVFADRGVRTKALDGEACAIAGLRCLRELSPRRPT